MAASTLPAQVHRASAGILNAVVFKFGQEQYLTWGRGGSMQKRMIGTHYCMTDKTAEHLY